MKPIRLSGHAREQALFRGAAESEIIEAIETSTWSPADSHRLECRKTFPYASEWNGKWYGKKHIRPIFVDENDGIVVVTVYVYFEA